MVHTLTDDLVAALFKPMLLRVIAEEPKSNVADRNLSIDAVKKQIKPSISRIVVLVLYVTSLLSIRRSLAQRILYFVDLIHRILHSRIYKPYFMASS